MPNENDRSAAPKKRKRVACEWLVEFVLEHYEGVPEVPDEIIALRYLVHVSEGEATSRDDAIAVAACQYMVPLANKVCVDHRAITVRGVRAIGYREVFP